MTDPLPPTDEFEDIAISNRKPSRPIKRPKNKSNRRNQVNFSLEESGQYIVILTIIVALPILVYYITSGGNLANYLKEKNFRAEFQESSHIFLSFYPSRLTLAGGEGKIAIGGKEPAINQQLTEKYQKYTSGIASKSLLRDLRIITFGWKNLRWCGLALENDKDLEIFYLCDSQNNFYTSWNSLPYEMRIYLSTVRGDSSKIQLRKDILMDEFISKHTEPQ